MTPLKLLENTESLRLMHKEDLEILGQLLQPLHVQKDQILIREGKRSPAAFLVIRGELQVEKTLPGKTKRVLVSKVPEGEWIGMVSIIDGEPATATITALGDGQVLAMDRANFETFQAQDSATSMRFSRTILACMAQQLLRVNQHLLELRSVTEKQ